MNWNELLTEAQACAFVERVETWSHAKCYSDDSPFFPEVASLNISQSSWLDFLKHLTAKPWSCHCDCHEASQESEDQRNSVGDTVYIKYFMSTDLLIRHLRCIVVDDSKRKTVDVLENAWRTDSTFSLWFKFTCSGQDGHDFRDGITGH